MLDPILKGNSKKTPEIFQRFTFVIKFCFFETLMIFLTMGQTQLAPLLEHGWKAVWKYYLIISHFYKFFLFTQLDLPQEWQPFFRQKSWTRRLGRSETRTYPVKNKMLHYDTFHVQFVKNSWSVQKLRRIKLICLSLKAVLKVNLSSIDSKISLSVHRTLSF